MNKINRQKVQEFLNEHDCSPLMFEGYKSSKEEFISGEYSVESMVKRTMTLTKDFPSFTKDGENFESSNGKWRSVFDIWRHIIYYYPEVTIFDVMHVLYSIQDECGGQFCNSVDRRTFKLKAAYNNTSWLNEQSNIYNLARDSFYIDEFNLSWRDWKDI